MPWRPAHDAHAIERASITVQFAEPIPSRPWQTILNAATQTHSAAGFASVDEIEITQPIAGPPVAGQGHIIQFMMGPAGVTQTPSGQMGAAGRTFQIFAENQQVREESILHRNRFTYAATRYDGWSQFSKRFSQLVSPALESALVLIGVNSLKLEYWDRFTYDGDMKSANYADLVKAGSKFIAPFMLDLKELMHCHSGFFQDVDGPRRTLVNVNVDALDVAEVQADGPVSRRSVGIYSMANVFLSLNAVVSTADINATMDAAHTTLKNVLGDIITADMANRISLHSGTKS